MAGPWEKYSTADKARGITVEFPNAQGAGPWSKYAQPERQMTPEQREQGMAELKGRIGQDQQGDFLTRFREGLDDATRGLAQGLTFGASDEIMAGLNTPIEMASGALSGEDSGKGFGERISGAYDRSLDRERALDAQARERSPAASLAGEIVGGVTSGGGLAKGGVTLLNAARPTAASMIGRGAAEGAAYGGVYGFNTGEGVQDRLSNAASGAALGAATGGAVGALGARQAAKASFKAAPTSEELRSAAQAAYQSADDAGVIVGKPRIDRMLAGLKDRLAEEGMDPTLHANVTAAFNRLAGESGNNVTFKGLDILRRVANSAGRNLNNPDEARLAGHIVDAIDDVMNNLRPSDVIGGDAKAASKAIVQGRDLWKRMRKNELLENLIERATDRVGANYTAAGMQTAIRQELRSLLQNKRNIRGFSKEEKAMIRGIVRGGPVENVFRMLGKFAPRGVVGATLGGGAGMAATGGNPLGAAVVWGAGEAGKRASAAMTTQKLNNLIEFVRRGGPRALEALPAPERQALEAALGGAVALEQEVILPQQRMPAAQ